MSALSNSNAIDNGGAYTLSRSLRFRSSASAYLNRTFTTPTSATIFTWSGWVKRGTLGTVQAIFSGSNGTNTSMLFFDNTDVLGLYWNNGATVFTTTAVFRDPSAWYHIVCYVSGTTQRIYVNNQLLASTTSGATPIYLNTAIAHYISYQPSQTRYIDGYLAEVNFIDGQALTPSSFGATNPVTGVWAPLKYSGTYGTNGFYLPFSNNSTASTLCYDFSGNNNNWAPNNISVTAGTTYDSMTDVPTLSSPVTANYAAINPLISSTNSIQNANLSVYRSTAGSGVYYMSYSSFVMTSGKWYFEMTLPVAGANGPWATVGIFAYSYASTTSQANYPSYPTTPNFYGVGANASGDVLGVAYDADNGKIWFSRNGTWLSGDPSAGTTPSYSGITVANNYLPGVYTYTNGLNSDGYHNFNFGQQPYTYTIPTGFNRLNTYNLPTSTIVQGNKYMDATLYTGNGYPTGGTQVVVNAGQFKPDLIWVKERGGTGYNIFTDSVRGLTKNIFSNSTIAEYTNNGTDITSINSNGFSLGADTGGDGFNRNGVTTVAWQWQAGQGSTSSNTNGSITSTVSVNASAGFSVVTYTGTGTANQTVGHGLGVAPAMVIIKGRGNAFGWATWHKSLGTAAGTYLALNTTAASATDTTMWQPANNSSTVISVSGSASASSWTNAATTYVAYCWAEIAGFSKFTSYTGNGSSDGPFIYTGFRPKFIIIKMYSGAIGQSWSMQDTSRSLYNVSTIRLQAESSNAESNASSNSIDILSNGFKIRTTDNEYNNASYSYIVMAWAENPFRNSLAR